MHNFKSRLLTPHGVERAAKRVLQGDPNEAAWTRLRGAIGWYSRTENSLSLSSYARRINGNAVEGFVGASLISDDALDQSRKGVVDKLIARDPAMVSPLERGRLAFNNGQYGSTLYIGCLEWSPAPEEDEIQFLETALEGVVRWFEGNRIDAIMIPARERLLRRIEPIVTSLEEQAVDLIEGGDGDFLLIIRYPWRPTGVSASWIRRLLVDYPDSAYNLPSYASRLNGRGLMEFEFDASAAISAGVVRWGGIAGYESWRRSASRKFCLNVASGRGEVVTQIRQLLMTNPRILTYYSYDHCPD